MNKSIYTGPIFLALLAAILVPQCVKPPDYPDEPVIKFTSISKTTMKQLPLGPDSVLISFEFTDGDGDLGSINDEPNIYIQDGRDEFNLPPNQLPYIPPQGAGNGISGLISIVVPSSCCIYNDPGGFALVCEDAPILFDTLTYVIWIKDQAGHESNKIETPPIGLICK